MSSTFTGRESNYSARTSGSDISSITHSGRESSIFTSYNENDYRIRLDFGNQTPFCGRRKELQALVNEYTQLSQTSRGTSVFIQGHAGCGKSRLVEAFKQEISKLESRKHCRNSSAEESALFVETDSPLEHSAPMIPLPHSLASLSTSTQKQSVSVILPLFCSSKFEEGEAASSEALGPILDCFNALTEALLNQGDENSREFWKDLLSKELKNDLQVLSSLLPGLKELKTSPPPIPGPISIASGSTSGIARSKTEGGRPFISKSQPATSMTRLPTNQPERKMAESLPTNAFQRFRSLGKSKKETASSLPPVPNGVRRSKTIGEPSQSQVRRPSSPRRIRSADDGSSHLDDSSNTVESLPQPPSSLTAQPSLDMPQFRSAQANEPKPRNLSLLDTPPTPHKIGIHSLGGAEMSLPSVPPLALNRSQTDQFTPSQRMLPKPLISSRSRAQTEGDSDIFVSEDGSTSLRPRAVATYKMNSRIQDMSMRTALLRTTSSAHGMNMVSQRKFALKSKRQRSSIRKFMVNHSIDEHQDVSDNEAQTGSDDQLRRSGPLGLEQEDYSVERGHFALREYLRCVCRERSVIFFLDDVQWAGREAMALFRVLLSLSSDEFMFIAAHRPLPRGHDIIKLINELKLAADKPVVTPPPRRPLRIQLDTLLQEDVNQLVGQLLKREEEDVQPLACLIHRKTGGNCFFAIEYVRLLENKGLILYSIAKLQWEWADLNEIAAKTEISDNVVDVVASKICEARQDVKLALLTAAAFGVARFSAQTLFRAIPGGSDMKESLVRRASTEIQISHNMPVITSVEALICTLEEACDENYLEPLGNGEYRFAHDRIREATMSLLPRGINLNNLRLRIGRQLRTWLLESQQDGICDEKLLIQVVIQLNQASDLITDENERVDLSELNYMAADNAIQRSSFFPASDFLRAGIELLGENPWETHYESMIKLSDALMRMDYCCGRLVVSVELANEILLHAQSFRDKRFAFHIKVLWLAQNDKVEESLDLILSVLDELGAPVPRRFLIFHRIMDWIRTERMLRGVPDEKLLSLPDATAEHLDDIGSFMERLEEVALNGSKPRPNLLNVALLRVMQLTLKHGRFSMTPTCLVSWGWANARAGRLDAAHRFGGLGVQLAKEQNGGYHDARAIMMYHMHIYHWRVPYHDGIKPTTEALQKLWDLGAIEYVFLDTIIYLKVYFCCGLLLHPLAQDIRKYVDLLKDYGHRLAFENHIAFFQTIASLIGSSESESEHNLSSEFVVQDGFADELDDHYSDLALQNKYFQRMMLAYFFNDIDRALQMSKLLWDPFEEGPDVFLPFRVFFIGMTAFSSYNRTRKAALLRQGRRMMTIMQRWNESGVVNVHHMFFLMKAEFHAARGRLDFTKVKRHFDEAIIKSGRRGFLHLQALANERAGIYCRNRDEHFWGQLYILQARELYLEWGAIAKAQKLNHQYGDYLAASIAEEGLQEPRGHHRGSTINSRTRLSELSIDLYKDLRTNSDSHNSGNHISIASPQRDSTGTHKS